MRTGTFIGLLAATVVSVAAAGYAVMSEGVGRLPAPAAAPLFGDLLTRANEVRTVTVESGKGKLTLRDKDGAWTLAESGGYPVPADKLRRLVAGLADLRLLEPKTDRPERHARLEVEDVTVKDAKSRKVTLLGADDKPLAALILGKANRTVDLNGLTGVYVRMPDEPLAWLAEGAVEVPTAAVDWVDRAVVDLPAEKLQSLRFAPVAAEAVTLTRDAAGFTLAPIPEGGSADPDAVQRLAAAFAGIMLDDVRADKDTDKAVKAGVAEAVTADGLTVTAELLALDGGTWMRLAAAAAEGSAAAGEAQAINGRVAGWLYKLPQFKAGLLQPKVEDYLKAEAAAPASSP